MFENNNKHLLNILNLSRPPLSSEGAPVLCNTLVYNHMPHHHPCCMHVSLKMLRKGHHSSDVRPNSLSSWIRRSACCLGRRIQFKTCTCGYFQEKKCRTSYRTDLSLIDNILITYLKKTGWQIQFDHHKRIEIFIHTNKIL